jgi:hypothetical protein
MRTHPSAQRIDALAYGVLEREHVEAVRAHIAGCERCASSLARRLAEADGLRRMLRSPAAQRRFAPLPWAAAALALLAVASFFGSPARPPAGRGRDAAAPPEVSGTFRTLPDGTQVLGSRTVRTSGWREIEVEAGEYYFDVARAEGMPFVVRTPAGEVRVVGTKFFLRVEEGSMNAKTGALVAVAVVSGAVILWNARGSLEVGPTQTAAMEPDAGPRRTDASETPAPVLEGESPQRRMAQLEAELRASRLRIEQLEARAAGGPSGAARTEGPAVAEVEAAQARFVEIVKRYASGTAVDDDMAELMKMAKDRPVFGRILEGLRRRIEANPDDIEARLQLVQAESAGIHVAESIADRAAIGQRVREQIAEVLKRDPDNWEARYTKAVGISHSQRDPKGRADAIREFEAVRTLQESRPLEPRFARTYAQLALVYLSERNTAKARETLEAGLARHPDSDALRRQLESLPTAGG